MSIRSLVLVFLLFVCLFGETHPRTVELLGAVDELRASEKQETFGRKITSIPLQDDFDPGQYRGKIIAVTQRSMIVQLCGSVNMEIISYLDYGMWVRRSPYIQNNNQAPIEFVFSGLYLNLSGLNPDYHGSYPSRGYLTHRVGDLQCGDIVDIVSRRNQGVQYAGKVTIVRRPGGTIPPSQANILRAKKDPELGSPVEIENRKQKLQENAEFLLQITFKLLHNQAHDADVADKK